MRKNIFYALLMATMTFVACKKSNNDPTTPEIPVADANGIIERFNFDGNLNGLRRTNIAFSNPNNATVTGTDRRGNANRALVVPAGASLTIDNLPLVTGGGSRTIFCWVHPNSGFSDANLTRAFAGYGVDGQSFGLAFEGNDKIKGYLGSQNNSIGERLEDGFFVGKGNPNCYWMPIVAIYNQSANKLTFYYWDKNNKYEITPTSTTDTKGTTLRIGQFPGVSTSSSNGTFMIDDLIIYNRALSESEIQTLFEDGRPECN